LYDAGFGAIETRLKNMGETLDTLGTGDRILYDNCLAARRVSIENNAGHRTNEVTTAASQFQRPEPENNCADFSALQTKQNLSEAERLRYDSWLKGIIASLPKKTLIPEEASRLVFKPKQLQQSPEFQRITCFSVERLGGPPLPTPCKVVNGPGLPDEK
jgi:hypothetical protein